MQDSAAQKLFGLSENVQTEELEVKQMDGLIAKVTRTYPGNQAVIWGHVLLEA